MENVDSQACRDFERENPCSAELASAACGHVIADNVCLRDYPSPGCEAFLGSDVCLTMYGSAVCDRYLAVALRVCEQRDRAFRIAIGPSPDDVLSFTPGECGTGGAGARSRRSTAVRRSRRPTAVRNARPPSRAGRR